jgi:hypothetical protein
MAVRQVVVLVKALLLDISVNQMGLCILLVVMAPIVIQQLAMVELIPAMEAAHMVLKAALE